MNSLNIIRDSFESWYNMTFQKDSPISAVINYSDEQRLSIKAIHTARIELCIIGIKDNLSYVVPIASIQENYNHGLMSGDEMKEKMVSKLLSELYNYRR